MSKSNASPPRRLNDTAALTQRPLEMGVEHTVSTRKVGDGYVTRTSSYNEATGKCTSTEQLSKTPPKIIPPRVESAPADAAGSLGLADAKVWMGRR